MDWGFGMCSGNTSKKRKKAAIFCLNIPLTKSIDHPWGSWEREKVRWRGVFYPLITPTFTPSCLAVVVLLLVAPLLYSLESQWDWSYFMLQLPGPQFENSACQFFARRCHMARSGLSFSILTFFFWRHLEEDSSECDIRVKLKRANFEFRGAIGNGHGKYREQYLCTLAPALYSLSLELIRQSDRSVCLPKP